MLRQELLALAGQTSNANQLALGLARRITTRWSIAACVDECAASLAKEDARASRYGWLVKGACFGLVAAIVWVVFCTTTSKYPWGSLGAYLLVGIPFALLGLAHCADILYKRAKREQTRIEQQLEWLAPVGTNPSGRAMHYAEAGHAEVWAWRDQALAERDQLYAFDVEMMRCLYEFVEAVRYADRRKAQGQPSA